MSKRILSLLLFTSFYLQDRAQICYYDATDLAQWVNPNSSPHRFRSDAAALNAILPIIRKYYPELSNNGAAVVAAITTTTNAAYNPILAQYLTIPTGAAGLAVPKASSILSAAGNINVTNFVDGLAKFLIERSKEELDIAFFRKFQEYLTKYPEAKIVFPSTSRVINHIAAYNYSAMLPALRTNFQKDLNTLCGNLLDLRSSSNYDNYNTDNTVKARADAIINFLTTTKHGRVISGSLVIANSILKGDNAADAINVLSEDQSCNINDNYSNLVHFVNLISGSIRSRDEGRIWITGEQIKGLVENDDALLLYFGLLYAVDQHTLHAGHHIEFQTSAANTLTLQQFLTDLYNQWNVPNGTSLKVDFTNFLAAASSVATNSKNIVDEIQKGIQPGFNLYLDYTSSLSDFLKYGFNFLQNHPGINALVANITATIDPYLSVIDNSLDACYDVKCKNYTSLVLHINEIINAFPNANSEFTKGFIKYATFIASVAEAKNSDEVKQAIEAIVLPVGSSSVKRESYFNIAINSYLGGFVGTEYLPTLKTDQWGTVVGVAAPVGIAFSWGRLFKGTKGGGGKSVTFFLPLIDVGAVASFRLKDEQSEVASEIKLENIIAPGAYAYFGFGKCPISIGVGGQYGPQLREVTTTDVKVEKNYYFRFAVNVLVDIPLLNLYTKN